MSKIFTLQSSLKPNVKIKEEGKKPEWVYVSELRGSSNEYKVLTTPFDLSNGNKIWQAYNNTSCKFINV